MPAQKNNALDPSPGVAAETRVLLLNQLNGTVNHLIETYQQMPNPGIALHDGWTAKAILGHITFWHESFARNVFALSNGQEPVPLK